MVPRNQPALLPNVLITVCCCATTWLAGTVPVAAQSTPGAPQVVVVNETPAPPCNLHLVVTEEFLNRFVARQEIEPGPIQEQLEEVTVHGEQCTNTRLSLDLLPSLDKAHAQFVLEGDVQTRATGYTEQAAVHTIGRQHFRATKDLFFNGETLATRNAAISVSVQSQNVGVQTRLDRTLFGPVANRMAARIAEQRRPQSEEMTRQRVTERVSPRFNSEVDQKLADANDLLENRLHAALKKYELTPAACRITTTDRHLHYAAALVNEGTEISAPAPRADLAAVHAVNFYLHESAINGLIDRLKLKGLKTTDRELRSLGSRLQSLRGEDPEEESPLALGMNLDTQIEFDKTRPMWVELNNEQMTLRIRATVRPMGQAIMPPVELAIPVRLVERGKFWELVPSEVDVQPQPGADGSGRLPDMTVRLIRDAFKDSLNEVQFPRELAIPSWPQDKPKLQLTAVRAVDGWLAVSLD